MHYLFEFTYENTIETPLHEAYVSKVLSEDVFKQKQAYYKGMDAIKQEAKLPLFLTVIFYICFYGGAILLIGLLQSLFDITRQRFLEVGVWFLVVGVSLLTISLAIYLYDRFHQRKIITPHIDSFNQQQKDLINAIFKDLEVPKTAIKMDVLTKHDKKITLSRAPYLNRQSLLFRIDNDILLYAFDQLYKLPILDMVMTDINKRLMFQGWHKDEDPRSETYKPYTLPTNQREFVVVRGYVSIQVKDYYFYIPNYEKETFKALLD